MRRKLLTFATVLSLALCATTLALWLRSYAGPDYVHYTSAYHWFLGVNSGHGTVDVLYIPHWPQEPELRRGRYSRDVYYGTRYSRRVLGFGGGTRPNGGRFVNVPHWFLACCTALPVLVWARAVWSRRRQGAGVCLTCGYDLRATPDRCPECGMVARGDRPPHNPPMQRTATASSGAVQ